MMAMMNDALLGEAMARRGITIDDLYSRSWTVISQRNAQGIVEVTDIVPIDDPVPAERPISYGIYPNVEPPPVDIGNWTWQVYPRTLDEEATARLDAYTRQAAERFNERIRQQLIEINENQQSSITEAALRQRLNSITDELGQGLNELMLLHCGRSTADATGQAQSATDPHTIPCSCGYMHAIDPEGDDYAAGLAFCAECGAGYSLEFDGDRLTGWSPFSAA